MLVETIARVGRRPIKISTTSLSFNMIDIFYPGWRPQHRRGRCRRRYTTMILLLYGQRSLHTSALSHLLCALTLTLRWQSTTFCFQSHSWSWTEKARPGGHRRAWKKLSMIVKIEKLLCCYVDEGDEKTNPQPIFFTGHNISAVDGASHQPEGL